MNGPSEDTVAYFSMEIALHPQMPTYSGGLGVLAGDTIRSAADLNVPMVAVTLVHRKGYFNQTLDANGWQIEAPAEWMIEKFCQELPARVSVTIEDRPVYLRAWRYSVRGLGDHMVPVLLLDTDLPNNSPWDRELTNWLYGGDDHYRLCQEVVLGMGGVRMLRALGYISIQRFHMNEGHASLLAFELLNEMAASRGRSMFTHEDIETVRHQCVFTTHTPVPAGNDQFPLGMAASVIGHPELFRMSEVFCCEGVLNMTYLALNLSHYVNGVARRHRDVSRQIYAPHDPYHHYQIDYITNGVHLDTWVAPSLRELFDRHIPGWHEDNSSLRSALRLPGDELWNAHAAAKKRLIEEINTRARTDFDLETLTIGFARRATAYKRATLVLTDPQRLRHVAAQTGRLQIVFAGKAHPRDDAGKRLIQEIFRARDSLRPEIKMAYLENYDWEMARVLTSGADVWLNTPQPPLEASGTSGMKAALNGVPSFSVLDGWWIEGCIEDATGWAIGEECGEYSEPGKRAACDAASLYEKLEHTIVPCFYRQRDDWLRVMRHSIALNGSFFNTNRMVSQYVLKAYFE